MLKPSSDLELAMSIISRVCEVGHVKREHLLSKRRDDQTCLVRESAIWLIRRTTKLRFETIALILGRDHGTVITRYHKMDRRMRDHPISVLLGLLVEFQGLRLCAGIYPYIDYRQLEEALESALVLVEAQEAA